MSLKVDLASVLDGRPPLVVLESYDEKTALDQLLSEARKRRQNVHRWSATDGLNRLTFGPQISMDSHTHEPEKLLQHIKAQNQAAMYVMCDFHPYFNDSPKIIRLLKDIVLNHAGVAHTLVFVSHKMELPAELVRYSARVELVPPSDEEVMAIVREEATKWAGEHSADRVKADQKALDLLVANVRGLGQQEIRRLVRGAIADDGAITEEDIPVLNRAKFALMDMEGILSFEYRTSKFAQVGGLDNLKQWLKQRQKAFVKPGKDDDVPKGVLLLGVQGGGKSLAAKAVAGMWDLPLLRLDMGALYNKYFGETERNLRESLSLADNMSPCVLWLDEIEKGLAQGSDDHGTSKRVLGTLLTWMAERDKPVFMVATSNDISSLPAELVRKGRFDEIFFVDLPGPEARQKIFEIHLAKRGYSGEMDWPALMAASEGFTGAEIEQAIIDAGYAFGSGKRDLGSLPTEMLLAELHTSVPLSQAMAEQVNALRMWARDRAVLA
ncbi:MAG: AAA family ATPase [Cellvibrionaceae bacterium]|nr:AAA family ATPase [Cellvibrionaceae bacterium]